MKKPLFNLCLKVDETQMAEILIDYPTALVSLTPLEEEENGKLVGAQGHPVKYRHRKRRRDITKHDVEVILNAPAKTLNKTLATRLDLSPSAVGRIRSGKHPLSKGKVRAT